MNNPFSDTPLKCVSPVTQRPTQTDRAGSPLHSSVRLDVAPQLPEWMDLKAAARYVCISERKLRDWINRPHDALPSSQVDRGKISINRHDMDRWLRAHPHKPKVVDLGAIVDDVVSKFRKAS